MKKILLCVLIFLVSTNNIFAFGIAGTAAHLTAIGSLEHRIGYNPLMRGEYSDKYVVILILMILSSIVIKHTYVKIMR